jgi:hypothetical protein
MPDLLFFLIFGHLCGDFALQTDRMAREKRTSKSTLTLHVAVYTATIAAFMLAAYLLADIATVMRWISLPVLVFIFAEHWLQDYLKVNGGNGSKQSFYLDQALHMLILFALRLTVYHG